MCRLMAFVSSQTLDFPRILGGEFSEFVELSSFHRDGWGIAIDDPNQEHLVLSRAPEQASKSVNFDEKVHQMHGTGGLLHLRWATSGLENCDANTHPFVLSDTAFIHNGDIRPREALDKYIRNDLNLLRNGETDSERYFFLLMTEIEKLGLAKGIQSAIDILRSECTFSSINAILLMPEFLVVISEYDPNKIPVNQPSDYYELKFNSEDDLFVVASSGWNQNGWQLIEKGSCVLVNRNNLKRETLRLS